MTTAAHVLVNYQNKSDKSASGKITEVINYMKEHYRHHLVWVRNDMWTIENEPLISSL